MSSSEDAFDYESYALEWYAAREGPPLIKKKSRILATVVQNDVEGLRELLDSPKWYNVKDKHGYTLLQIAILRNNKDIFDYLLSLEAYPVDAVNKRGETALELSLMGNTYFSFALLQKNVKADRICEDGDSLLHCAFQRRSVDIAKLLIAKGADVDAVNCKGCTPLHWCLIYCHGEDLVEGVCALLCSGADPFVANARGELPFDFALVRTDDVQVAQEMLFRYTFDEHSRRTIGLHSLMQAAQKKWPFFFQLTEKISSVYYRSPTVFDIISLLSMETHYLEEFLARFEYAVEDVIVEAKNGKFFFCKDFDVRVIHNLDVLIGSRLKYLAIDFITNTNSSGIIADLVDFKAPLAVISEIVCYFLSYGMTLKGRDFQLIYDKFGYCELFKILLRMDVKEYDFRNAKIIPALFYNVKIYNVDAYLRDPYRFSLRAGIDELMAYSAHPKLKDWCRELDQKCLIDKARKLPHIPLLIELARDAFREYFIKKFNIATTKQFYFMLEKLPVGEIHKKIITFERRLYD